MGKEEPVDVTSADEKPVFIDTEDKQRLTEIEAKRNKSRLTSGHRNMLLGLRPYDQTHEWYHDTIKYKRRIFGRHGLNALTEPAGLAWPTLEEVMNAKIYERVAYPLTLDESWRKLHEEKQKRYADQKTREADMVMKMEKMQHWIVEMEKKMAQKKQELEAATRLKEQMIQEVRKHFNYTISTNDEQFKEMLAKLEKEHRKKAKEAKKAATIEKKIERANAKIAIAKQSGNKEQQVEK
ncbi:hypothetical protein KM043_008050 [Ampulex compressa]|nr:hypothetical protein KM043_008050 [Ampulex compressa]